VLGAAIVCPRCGDHFDGEADLCDACRGEWEPSDADQQADQQAFVEWLTEADDDRAEEARAYALAKYEEHLDDLVYAAEQRDEDGLWAQGC
jgi:hypothetical protein